MTPDEAKASHRRMMRVAGETITIRRYTAPSGTPRPSVTQDVTARVTGYAPNELVGGIAQGDRRLVVLADDLATGAVTLPLKKGDKAVVRGKELNIEAVDDSTRRVSGVLIALELQVRG